MMKCFRTELYSFLPLQTISCFQDNIPGRILASPSILSASVSEDWA